MGFVQSKGVFTPEIAEIQKETGFSLDQVYRLQKRFNLYDRDGDGLLGREDFLFQPSLTTNPLCDVIINAFFLDEKHTVLQQINFKQFALVLSRFLPENVHNSSRYNSTEEKLKFLFKLFDKDCDGSVSRADLVSLLNMLIGSQVSSEQLDKIVDQTITEADTDQDGKVSFEEFSKVMAKVNVNQKMTLTF